MSRPGFIIILGTSCDTRGGIAAVLNTYMQSGLPDRWPVIHLPTHRDGNRWQKFVVAARALCSFIYLLLTRQVRLLHVHAASRASFWRKSMFMLLAMACQRPIIFHLHGGGFLDFYERSSRFQCAIIRYVLGRVSYIVVLTEQWRSRIAAVTSNSNVAVIGNPIDDETLSALNHETNLQLHQTILYLGRLDRQKGVFDLVDAVARRKREFDGVRVLFAGDGETEALRRYAAEKGLGDMTEFIGWVSGEAKMAVLRRATVWVLPSYIEGMPMGLLEAMAAGVPVIATTVGGVPEVVEHEVGGLLVPPGDVDALADALGRLLADADLRARLSGAARQLIRERFACARVMQQVEALYKKLGARRMPDARHKITPA